MTYVVSDPETKDAVVIDPVWDYDPAASTLTTQSLDKVVSFVIEKQLRVHLILETHAHADHVSGAWPLRKLLPNSRLAIGEKICAVQQTFKKLLNLESHLATDGSQFDLLLKDGEVLKAGRLTINAIETPGHTPACLSYLIGDALFCGDALFMPDYGTGRCDFPLGSADELYHSIHQRLYELPNETRVFVGHDYQPGGRPLKYESSIGEQKSENIHIRAVTTRSEFVEFRTRRDATLSTPRLLYPSIQLNIRGGRLPEPETNGTAYLKIPLSSQIIKGDHD